MVKLRQQFNKLFNGTFRKNRTTQIESPLPTKGGRVSQQPGSTILSTIMDTMQLENPDYPFELLDAIYRLAIYDDDTSYAVDNIVQLGNTKYKLTFDDSVGEQTAKEAQAAINQMDKVWYNGGINSMINDLLANCVITGAISSEIVPKLDLTGVQKVVLVNASNIRIFYNNQEDIFDYYQKATRTKDYTTGTPGLIKLNPVTYKYYTYRTFGGKPYAIPPFAAALDGIQIDNDLVCGLKNIISRLGVFGFLSTLVAAPKKTPGQTQEQYYAACKTYLEKWVLPEVEKGFKKGVVVGFEGSHKFEMQNTTPSNIEGMQAILELISTKVHSGLKQDPMMLGRNQTTTETLGRVLLAKLGNQVRNYQKLVASFLEDVVLTHLKLSGYDIKSVGLEFAPAMIGDEVRDATAYNMRLTNLEKLFDQGIINQQQFALEAGYEEAAEEEPRVKRGADINTKIDPADEDSDPIDGNTTEANERSLGVLEMAYGSVYEPFNYCTDVCGCGSHEKMKMATFRGQMEKLLQGYLKAIKGRYTKALDKISLEIGKELANLDSNAGVEQVTHRILLTLYRHWGSQFTQPQQRVIKKWVGIIYGTFRKDKGIFRGSVKKVPKGVFNVEDARTIDFYSKFDSLYLGKFITDPDTKKKITAFIKKYHIAGNIPIGAGHNRQALAKFRQDFNQVLVGEEWKIERILRTTVSRMKNTASIMYMQQAELVEFERVEIIDRLTCAYCRELNGKKFSVSKSVDKIKAINSIEPGNIGVIDPFLVGSFTVDDIKGKSGEQLQDGGMFNGITPHPNCRGTNVAYFTG